MTFVNRQIQTAGALTALLVRFAAVAAIVLVFAGYASAQMTITTQSPLPIGVVPNGSQPNFYSQQIDVTGAPPNLIWSISRGITPPGTVLTQTGVIAGFPSTPGTFDFTVRVESLNPVQSTEKAFRIVINDKLQITTVSPLPDATLNVPYNQPLVATGGVAPYTWKSLSSLPVWLTLSNTGVLSGTPPSVGTFLFNVQVDDSFSPTQSAIRQFQVTFGSPLSITTPTISPGFVLFPFSQQLQSTGGTGAINWAFSGTLPQGLTLSSSGLLSGLPTLAESRTITVTATDSRGIPGSRDFTITVYPAVPIFSAPGLPATLVPASATTVAFRTASPIASDLTGTLVLTFTSKAEVPGDDPLTRFDNGSRSVPFTIPANTTTAVISPPVRLSAGTVAGTVRLAANLNGVTQDVTVATAEILSAPPKINNVVAQRTGSGLDVQITGFSTSRRISSADFTFEFVGGKAQPVTVSVPVGATFQAWFSSQSSLLQFGSSFSYLQSFTVTGAVASDIKAVTVRLTNAQGSTESSAVDFK